MITTKHGSIFDSRADVLVCPVNCVGVMGKGLALEFRKLIPSCYSPYRYACQHKLLVPGQIYQTSNIILAATKNHWRHPSRIEWVESCLELIAAYSNTKSLATPQLGCGCGGLDWADVWPLYEKHLGDLPVDAEVWIYE